MIIEELHLKSFKGFRDFELQCSQFTVLVGRNNGGKTSILQAIQLFHDIFRFAFGNGERPDFASPQWTANPAGPIRRQSYADPDAIWWRKRTSESCEISVKLSDNIEGRLEIAGLQHYELNVFRNGESIKDKLNEPENKSLIGEIFALCPAYVPPVGAVSPTEDSLAYRRLETKRNEGRMAECWRNELYWRWNDGREKSFDEMVETVGTYLPRATVRPPRQSHDDTPRILIEFQEEETTFDISVSGGGLLTILSLAFVLRFSDSKCLLLDEPDAHLHASLQSEIAQMLINHATEDDAQVFVATHSPTFIGECPVDSLVWIDRNERQSQPCTDIGLVLIDLGAITNADAIRVFGADKILFVEGSLDQRMLGRLLSLSDMPSPFDDESVIVARLPSGKGDIKYLKAFQSMILETFQMDVKIACISDSDYETITEDSSETADETDPLSLCLRRKEIENYLLDPAIIEKAATRAAGERMDRAGSQIAPPTVAHIQEAMTEILERPNIRDTVKWQVVHQYRQQLASELDESNKDRLAHERFTAQWNDESWRMRSCPGQRVLAALRQWCQEEFDLTLTNSKLIEAIEQCPDDILEIAEKLQSHFYPL